jgi:hypothetical protein
MKEFYIQRIARPWSNAIIRRSTGLCAGIVLVVGMAALALTRSALAAVPKIETWGFDAQVARRSFRLNIH